MTTPDPFWTNTILNITKPDLSITFNSYDLKYNTCNVTTTGCSPIPPNTSFKDTLFPSSANGRRCGKRWSSRVGRGVVVRCQPQDIANNLCPFDDNLKCPDNYTFLGQQNSGGNTCSDKCGGQCNNLQNFICGETNFQDSILK